MEIRTVPQADPRRPYTGSRRFAMAVTHRLFIAAAAAVPLIERAAESVPQGIPTDRSA